MNVNIIGAGPAGSFLGYLLAKEGVKVNIFEKDQIIGKPIQCTGLLSSIDEPLLKKGMPKFLVNTTDKITLHSPNRDTIIKRKEFIICRSRFDSYIADSALDEGAGIYLNHEFIRSEGSDLIIRDRKENKIVRVEKGITVGADGPLSRTAKDAGIFSSRKFYYGIQAVVEGRFDKKNYDVFFGKDITPDFFAWIVPESEYSARVGLASSDAYKARSNFDRFLSLHDISKIKGYQSGVIPLYDPKAIIEKECTFLLGDAAAQVKASTLGGILPSLKAAKLLKEAILTGRSYTRLWKRGGNLDLYLHLKLSRIFTAFTDKDWGILISYIDDDNIKKIISHMDREKPVKGLISLFLRKPALARFASKVIF